MDAVNAYDPKIGVDFEIYSLQKIRKYIIDELKSMKWLRDYLIQKEEIIYVLRKYEDISFADIAELVDKHETQVQKIYNSIAERVDN